MTKTDPALNAIRKVRHQISREFDNDPARLVEHYKELQRRVDKSKIVRGPDDNYAGPSESDAAQLGR